MDLKGIMWSEMSEKIQFHVFVESKKKKNLSKQAVEWMVVNICWRAGEIGDVGQNVQTSTYKMNKLGAFKVHHCNYDAANLENSAVATGVETVSFHSNPKDR